MPKAATNPVKRALMVTTASLAWFALSLQLLLTIRTSITNGMSVIGALATYFSFFTILTNLLVALVLTFSLLATKSRWGKFFSNPATTTGTALYIATVGIIYSLLLRHTWNPEGLNKLTDTILHDVVPVLYVAFWIFFVPRSGLRWKNPLSWAIYPIVYFAWVLLRGAVTGRYPYPFIDVAQLGYPRALLNAVALLLLVLMAGLAVIAVARWRPSPTVGG